MNVTPANEWSWPEAKQARRLWKDGVSARRIGQIVGRTRNAVIGYANRAGWGRHPNGHDYRLAK